MGWLTYSSTFGGFGLWTDPFNGGKSFNCEPLVDPFRG